MDLTLIEEARNGNQESEEKLFKELLVRFKYIAKRRIGQEECEDLAQEACMTILQKYKTETFTKGFMQWGHGVLKMKIGNYLQAKKRPSGQSEEFQDDYALHSAMSNNPDLKRFLSNCLSDLVKSFGQYARAVNLTFQGYNSKEISGRLGITVNNYYVVLSRGRSLLKVCLEEKGMTL